MDLSESDVLELLGYRYSGRRWLEVLGYEYSTEGVERFRSDRPEIESILVSTVIDVFQKTGRFPRTERVNGVHLISEDEDSIVLVEQQAKDRWRKQIFDNVADAAVVLVHRQCSRPELLSPKVLPSPRATRSTPKWDRSHKYAP